MLRSISADYRDPLDVIWLAAVEKLGFSVVRSPDVFASWDGRSTLTLCEDRDFDADDSLAQLIFHELCHGIVQGPTRRHEVDWGLDNTDDPGCALAEHACHRLQAALLDRYGLRALLAVTTDWRPYWDSLPADPLAPGDDPAIALARAAWPEALRGPWSDIIDQALRATAALADILRPVAPPTSLWSRTLPRHPVTGFAQREGATCGGCAWRNESGHCTLMGPEGGEGPRVAEDDPACLYFEPPLDCFACGACCREGFSAVRIEPDEALAASPPEGALPDGDGFLLPRPGGHCVALATHEAPWRCAIYASRPEACRAFEVAGPFCLIARRRVGLTRL